MPGPNNLLNYFLNSFGTFTKQEELLALDVFNVASEEIKQNAGFDYDSDEEEYVAFEEKVEATMENFKKIIRLFKEAEKAKLKFLNRFPEWSPLRMENIAKLRELAGSINTDRKNCNISKITSTCVSILGGITIGASFVFPPAAPILAPVGFAAAGAGGATVFGTSVTEISLLKKDMKEAQKVKEKEEEDFKLVSLWFKHSQELIDAFENIMGFSVARQLFEDLKKIEAGPTLRKRDMPSDLQNIIKDCVAKIRPSINPLAKILPAVADPVVPMAITLVPIAISFFVVIVLLRKNNSLVFDSVVLSHRVAFGLMELLDLGGDLGLMICNVGIKAGGAAGARATARMVANDVFAGIGIALDVTNLVFSSIDVHKGSISPYATQLTQAANQLEKEFEVINKIYNEIK